jgi:hypothetical protein
MKIYRGLWLFFFLVGCTAPLARSPMAPNTCQALDSQHRWFGALAKFSGALAGSGGLATLPIDPDKKELRAAVAVAALVLGGVSVAAVYVEQDAAASYARSCTVEMYDPMHVPSGL